MAKYRKYDWPTLLEEFEQSGVTQTQFCKAKDINPGYFCLRRSRHLQQEQVSPRFSKVEIETAPVMGSLTLEVGRCRVLCPSTLSLESLATLVSALA